MLLTEQWEAERARYLPVHEALVDRRMLAVAIVVIAVTPSVFIPAAFSQYVSAKFSHYCSCSWRLLSVVCLARPWCAQSGKPGVRIPGRLQIRRRLAFFQLHSLFLMNHLEASFHALTNSMESLAFRRVSVPKLLGHKPHPPHLHNINRLSSTPCWVLFSRPF